MLPVSGHLQFFLPTLSLIMFLIFPHFFVLLSCCFAPSCVHLSQALQGCLPLAVFGTRGRSTSAGSAASPPVTELLPRHRAGASLRSSRASWSASALLSGEMGSFHFSQEAPSQHESGASLGVGVLMQPLVSDFGASGTCRCKTEWGLSLLTPGV